MAYSTYVAEPKLYSVESRGISIFNVTPEIDLRIVDLSGIPIRIKIDSKFKYIYLKTGVKTSKEIKDEFSARFLTLFESLMTNFFKDDAYIYGVYNDKRLFIYDIYTNNNWFTFYDLTRIEKEYGYHDLGFELLYSLIKEKRFTTLQALQVFSEIIEKNPEKQRKLFILPYYDLVTATGYSFTSSGDGIPALEAGNTEEKIFGTYVGSTVPINVKKNVSVSEDENKSSKAPLLFEMINLTKDEREKAYKETKDSIFSFIERKKYQLSEDERSCVIIISYLWAMWSHLNMRGKIIDYLSEKNNYIFLRELNRTGNRDYSYLMLSLWYHFNSQNLNRMTSRVRKNLSAAFIRKILEEEFTYFEHCFDIILKDTLVKINANASK
jgi:hypothetical protein